MCRARAAAPAVVLAVAAGGGYGFAAPIAADPFWRTAPAPLPRLARSASACATVAYGDPQLGGVSNGSVGTINPDYSIGYRLAATSRIEPDHEHSDRV